MEVTLSFNKFTKGVSGIKKKLIEAIRSYPRSANIVQYFIDVLESVLYSNLLSNILKNITQANIKELGLSSLNAKEIRSKFSHYRKLSKVALPFKHPRMNEVHYDEFRESLAKEYPEILPILIRIERLAGKEKFKTILLTARKEFWNASKVEVTFDDAFTRLFIEAQIKKGTGGISGKRLILMTQKVLRLSLEPAVKIVTKEIEKDRSAALRDHRINIKAFQIRLFRRWQKPFDLLEGHIGHSTELVIRKRAHLVDEKGRISDFKALALLKLNARALQVSNEILVLLKAGYADGAFARWRTLYELSLIALYLGQNDQIFSQRYLDHEVVGKLKTAKKMIKFKKSFKVLPTRKDLSKLNREREVLCAKYGEEFKQDYGWIPKAQWPGNKIGIWFLENQVRLGHLGPYYDLACRTVHGGAAGFVQMSLMDHAQGTLQTGPTNYGLADPIQHCGFSITHLTLALLNLNPDFDSVVHMKILVENSVKLAREAAEVQFNLEKEEQARATLESESFTSK